MDNKQKEYILYRLKRAKEALNDAKYLIENGSWNAAMNRLYYSCFYSAIALLYKYDIETKSHKGVRNQLGQYFVKQGLIPKEFGQIYSDLFDLRQKGDYGDLYDLEPEKVKPFVQQVELFMKSIEEILSKD